MSLRVPAAVSALAGLTLSAAVAAQVEYREDSVRRGGIPVAEQPSAAVDLRTLWFHLDAGRLTAAREELQRLRNAHPDWEPDADIRAALAPPPVTGPDPYGTEMRAIASLEPDALPASRLAAAAREARARRDGENLRMLAWRYLAREEAAIALGLFEDAQAAGGSPDREGMISALTRLAREAGAAGDSARVGVLSQRSRALDGPDLLLQTGWAERDAGRHASAAALFRAALPLPAASEGLALSLHDAGQPEAARGVACDGASDSDSLAQLCASWLDAALAEAYARGDYRATLALFQQRQALPGDAAAARELAAWAQYALGEREAAASHPAVAAVLLQQEAAIALARKQFDRAARLAATPALTDRDSLSVAMTTGRRERSGDRGLGALDHAASSLSLSRLQGRWRLGGTLGWNDFSSGRPASDAAFGSAASTAPATALAGVSDPSLHLWGRREGPGYSLYGQVGRDLWRQPAGEEISALLQASVFTDPLSSHIELFARPIADSLLSRTGVIDPADGAAWGGVMDRGLAARTTWSTPGDWHLSVNGAISRQTGDEVDDNRALSLRIDLRSGWPGQDLRDSVDYWQIGPFASWRGFDDNQFGFVRGRGGYFSPQDEYRVGLSSELLTAEGRRWQLRAGVELAWTDITEEAAAGIPGQTTRGVNIDARLQGHWLVTPQLQLGARLQATDARGFRGSHAAISLQWFPQGRRAVWSRELQSDHAQ